MYRLERITEYKSLNFSVEIIETSFDFKYLSIRMKDLMTFAHFGEYQIVKVELLENEHTQRIPVEGYKIKS